jgi:hypothetical protein
VGTNVAVEGAEAYEGVAAAAAVILGNIHACYRPNIGLVGTNVAAGVGWERELVDSRDLHHLDSIRVCLGPTVLRS